MNRFSLNDIAAVADAFAKRIDGTLKEQAIRYSDEWKAALHDAIGMIGICKTIDDGINHHEKPKEHYNIPASAVYEYVRKHEADIVR